MKKLILIIPFLFIIACKPPEVECAKFIEVDGMSRKGVDYNINQACSSMQKYFPAVDLLEKMDEADIKMTLYRASFFGKGPQTAKRCTGFRSGTCTSFRADGTIEVEIEKGDKTAEKIIHETKHVALRLLYPALPPSEHHRWMAKNNECSVAYDSCGLFFGPDTSF